MRRPNVLSRIAVGFVLIAVLGACSVTTPRRETGLVRPGDPGAVAADGTPATVEGDVVVAGASVGGAALGNGGGAAGPKASGSGGAASASGSKAAGAAISASGPVSGVSSPP